MSAGRLDQGEPRALSSGLTSKDFAGAFSGMVAAEPVNDQVRTLESQISKIQTELELRKSRNAELRLDLQKLETMRRPGDGATLLVERDRLKEEVQTLVREFSKKNDSLRKITATYKMLLEENEQLTREVAELEKNEPLYDKTIEEHSAAMQEYEQVRAALEEHEFKRSEQMLLTQLRLEENSRKQMETQVRDIAEKMGANKDLAKQYLKKYVQYLEEELAGKPHT